MSPDRPESPGAGAGAEVPSPDGASADGDARAIPRRPPPGRGRRTTPRTVPAPADPEAVASDAGPADGGTPGHPFDVPSSSRTAWGPDATPMSAPFDWGVGAPPPPPPRAGWRPGDDLHMPVDGGGAPGVEEIAQAIGALVVGLRWAARQIGVPEGEIEDRVADTLAFLRRRFTGEYEVDEFGFDADFTENVYLPLLRPLYRLWFRVEVRGVHHLPDRGGGLVVANHSGTIALDSLMTQLAVHDEHPAGRHLRMLAADLVFATPLLGEVARKAGATLASPEDAQRLLQSGHLVGVWPEGFKGVGKPFSERYRLQRFGRGGFVSSALRARVPIIPCGIVGAEETYPILTNLPAVAKTLRLPYFPVTPTFPHFGALGLVPLPSKWIIEFGAPLYTDHLDEGAADDPVLVFDLTDRVRETIQRTLYALLAQRGTAFF